MAATMVLINTSPAGWIRAYKIGTVERDGLTWTKARTVEGDTYFCHPDKVRPDTKSRIA